MRAILMALCLTLAMPVVAQARHDAELIIMSGLKSWADSNAEQRKSERLAAEGRSEAEEEEKEESFTIKPRLDPDRECDGMERYVVERNGRTIVCRESVTCKITCRDIGW